MGDDIVATNLISFLKAMKLDPDNIQGLIRSEPPKTLKLGPNFFKYPKAEAAVNAAIENTDSTLTPWFSLGKTFSDIKKAALAKKQGPDPFWWVTSFRRAMEDADIPASDRDDIVAALRNAVTAVDQDAYDRFEPTAERIRDCGRKVALEKLKMSQMIAPPPPPTTKEKLGFLIAILVFAGFYLFQANLLLAFLWFVFSLSHFLWYGCSYSEQAPSPEPI